MQLLVMIVFPFVVGLLKLTDCIKIEKGLTGKVVDAHLKKKSDSLGTEYFPTIVLERSPCACPRYRSIGCAMTH